MKMFGLVFGQVKKDEASNDYIKEALREYLF